MFQIQWLGRKKNKMFQFPGPLRDRGKSLNKDKMKLLKGIEEHQRKMDTKLLPKNHLTVQVLEESSASERAELRRRLRDYRDDNERCTAYIEASYIQRAIDDLENGNYRSLYLERALKGIGE